MRFSDLLIEKKVAAKIGSEISFSFFFLKEVHVLEQVWQQISLKLCEPQLLLILAHAWYMSTQRAGRVDVAGSAVL